MSAQQSQLTKMHKKYGAIIDGYQRRIETQAASLDRLVQANLAYGAALSRIAEPAKEEMEKPQVIAMQALAEVKKILAVPNKEENTSADAE